jgi:hypothetical protein
MVIIQGFGVSLQGSRVSLHDSRVSLYGFKDQGELPQLQDEAPMLLGGYSRLQGEPQRL